MLCMYSWELEMTGEKRDLMTLQRLFYINKEDVMLFM
jgi:hypothetical protein